jgi:NAD(P)-dependent dehydrogenase (short-subunit alcohol dehydrogenase family)
VTKGATPTAEEHAFHPAGRVGTVDDITALVTLLVGPESGFITGSEFVVDGGVTRKMICPQ